jgi:hypothetical protein
MLLGDNGAADQLAGEVKDHLEVPDFQANWVIAKRGAVNGKAVA